MGNFCDSCTSRNKQTKRVRHAVSEDEADWLSRGIIATANTGSMVPIHCVVGDSLAQSTTPIQIPRPRRYVACRTPLTRKRGPFSAHDIL